MTLKLLSSRPTLALIGMRKYSPQWGESFPAPYSKGLVYQYYHLNAVMSFSSLMITPIISNYQ